MTKVITVKTIPITTKIATTTTEWARMKKTMLIMTTMIKITVMTMIMMTTQTMTITRANAK